MSIGALTQLVNKILGERMRWRGDYQSIYYSKNDVVSDQEWLMIANKGTYDRASPQPIKDPFYVSGFGDTPAWPDASSLSANILFAGQRYTFGQSGYINKYRVWIPDISGNFEYSIILVENPQSNPVYTVLADGVSPSSVGWVEFNASQDIVLAGDEFDLLLATKALSTPNSFVYPWDYRRGTGAPPAGGVRHSNAGTPINFSYIDANSDDRESELQNIVPGSTISAGAVQWEVLSSEFFVDYVSFDVIPLVTLSPVGLYDFNFSYFGQASIPYVAENNYYSTNVQGIFGVDDIDAVVLNQNAYGVDIQLQEAYISEDWDFMSRSKF